MATAWTSCSGPFGWITVFVDDRAVVALEWGRVDPPQPGAGLDVAVAELEAYFAGGKPTFTVPVRPAGGVFYRRAWQRLAALPWGATATYGALAAELATAPRAIARACASNPIPIIIPCHRVVGSGGRLGGYSGGEGIATKAALLAQEGVMMATAQPAPLKATHTMKGRNRHGHGHSFS